jgi:hypothetical protein
MSNGNVSAVVVPRYAGWSPREQNHMPQSIGVRRGHVIATRLLSAVLLTLLAGSAEAASLAKQCRRECRDEVQTCRQDCAALKGSARKKCRKECKRSLIGRCRADGLTVCTTPADPCSGAAQCDRRTLDDEEVVTGSTDTGYRSVITGPRGVAEIVWTVSGASTSFHYRPPGGAAGPEVTVTGVPADAAGTTNAAMLLHRSRSVASARSYTGPNTLGNTSGCDQTHGFDCGPNGKCCDIHDECITQRCGGQGECGNVLGALEAAYGSSPCSADCLQCHGAVVKCFFDGSHPGPSNCCEDGNCGQSQECMISGRVITDPCRCKDAGIASVTDCSATCTECSLNFAGCLPDGTVAQNPSCCCSCTLLLSSPAVCACQDTCCPDFPGCEAAGVQVSHFGRCCSCAVSGSGLGGICQ